MGLMWGRCGGEGVRSFCPPFLCSICHQSGHKAEMCPNGQVDWLTKLGNRAFQLRPSQFWTLDTLNPSNSRFAGKSLESIEKDAREYFLSKCRDKEITIKEISEFAASTYDQKIEDIISHARASNLDQKKHGQKTRKLNNFSSGRLEKKDGMPDGWSEVHDSHGRTYYWNKINNTTQWTRP